MSIPDVTGKNRTPALNSIDAYRKYAKKYWY